MGEPRVPPSGLVDRLVLLVLRFALRALDLSLLLPRPRMWGPYLQLFWRELRHSPYYWPTSFAATLSRQKVGQSVRELVYGETPLLTGLLLFRRAGVGPGKKFVDLGAGRGRALLAAAWLGAEARGVELLAEHVRWAEGPLARLGIRLTVGDGANADLRDADFVYLSWSGFDPATRQRFAGHLRSLSAGARIILLDAPIDAPEFPLVSRHDLLFPWGFVPVWVQAYRPASSPDLPAARS